MIKLTPEIIEALQKEALRGYPNEACGFLLGPQAGVADEFIPVLNIQDQLHARDPERFPRTAQTAYSIDPRVQMEIFDSAQKCGKAVTGIFHSHPDHDAYFSAEDKAMAAPWGEPLLPGLAYVVISVYNREVKAIRQFYWDPKQNDFAESDIVN